jgi:GxxExxY protein
MQEGHDAIPPQTEQIARSVVDAALTVHRALGPGLLESTYEACLAHELETRGHYLKRQIGLPVIYGEVKLEIGYRVDLIVDDTIIVEIKAVEAITPVHKAQLLTYLRLTQRRLGLPINFNVVLLKDGISRMIV